MITVLYWNQNRRSECAIEALEDSSEYDVLAVQEPWINRQTMDIYCPNSCKYRKVWGSGRAAIYIHKRHEPTTWTYEVGEDWAKVTFTTANVTVYSIYSARYTTSNWHTPIHDLITTEPETRTVLVGDFNQHHPLWDKEGRISNGVNDLLTLVQRWELRLATP